LPPPETRPPGSTTSSPPGGTTPPTTPKPPADHPYLAVVWLPGVARLQVTVTNPTESPTTPLAIEVSLSGATLNGQPSGCGLLTSLLTASSCGISPVPPGGSRTISVGVSLKPGQSPKARVGVCEASLLSLDCRGGLLGSLVAALV
jgi:hypothetical protein